jgi:hypothetical protein
MRKITGGRLLHVKEALVDVTEARDLVTRYYLHEGPLDNIYFYGVTNSSKREQT